MRYAALLMLSVLVATPAAAKGKVKPLFASDTPLAIEIDGPVRAIAASAEKSTDPRPGTLRAAGEALGITLAARGNARRRKVTCKFPPLRVTFAGKPVETSLFEGQKSLKMVTHCGYGANAEQLVLREYAAYRLYQRLSDQSLKVRLLDVRYTEGGKETSKGIGFFIEDTDDAARRFGLHEIDVIESPLSALDRTAAARNILFQYMIGNNDWNLARGSRNENCCHNYKLLAVNKEARTSLIPVPYDFDYAGLVDAPYALPPEQLALNNVRSRYFRGCSWKAETLAVIPEFRAKQAALIAEINAIPRLTDKTRADMLGYLGSFFAELDKPEATLFKRCN